jgi:hypothetical protein
MAENHQRRCNPAILVGAEPFFINQLEMAKYMHAITP